MNAEFRARAASLVGKLESPELKVAQYPVVRGQAAGDARDAREVFFHVGGDFLWQVMTDRRVVSAVESKDVAALRDVLLGYVSDRSRAMREVREQFKRYWEEDSVIEALQRFDSIPVLGNRQEDKLEDGAWCVRIKGVTRPEVVVSRSRAESEFERRTVWVVEEKRVLALLRMAGVESDREVGRTPQDTENNWDAVVRLRSRDDMIKVLTCRASTDWCTVTVGDLPDYENPFDGCLRTDDFAFYGVDGTGKLKFEPYAFSQYETALEIAESWLKDAAAHAEEFVEAGVKSFHGPCELTMEESGYDRDSYLVVESLEADLEKLIKRWGENV